MDDVVARTLSQFEDADREPQPKRLSIFLGLLALAGLTFGVYASITGSDAPAEDPYAALDALALNPEAEQNAASLDNVDFPEVLAAADTDLSAILETAAQEHALLENPGAIDPSDIGAEDLKAQADSVIVHSQSALAALPAGDAVDGDTLALSAQAETDPMLASSLEEAPIETAENTASQSSDEEPAQKDPGQWAKAEGKAPYALQIASYRSRAEAETFAKALEEREHDNVFIEKANLDERGVFYRVRIGYFKSRPQAHRYGARFEDREELAPFVVELRSSD